MVVGVSDVKDEFGTRRDVEISGDAASGGLVEFGGPIDVEIVVGFSGRSESGGLVHCGDEITRFVVC